MIIPSKIDNRDLDNSTCRILLIGNFLSKSIGTRSVSEELRIQLERNGWSIISTSSQPNRLLRLTDMLWTILHFRTHYQLVNIEVYSGQAFIWAYMCGLLLSRIGKPFCLTLHGGNLPEFARKHTRRVQRLLSCATAVVTPSRMLQEALSPLRDDIQYLPNALNLQRYPFRLRSDPTRNICWLRAFHEIYNPTSAVRALALLKEEFEDATLTMIGPDKGDGTLQAVEDLSEQLGISDSLHLVGAVPKAEVPQWLNKGDIFLNTTRYESFGVSVMEAAAVGLPIVTTNVGELPYLWGDGEDALLVPPDDPQAIANALQRILTEPRFAGNLSRNARRKAEQYDWSEILPQWETLLRRHAVW